MSDEFKYLLVTIEYEPFAHLGRSVVSNIVIRSSDFSVTMRSYRGILIKE